LSYAFRGERTEAMLFGGRLDTARSGTPALPMDIGFVRTDLAGLRSRTEFGGSVLEFALSRSDVDHAMDNFSLRPAPASPMDYRATRALADGVQWRIAGQHEIGDGELRVGIDGSEANHAAVISNPNVPAFSIDNFNDVERDVLGLYGQWNQAFGSVDIEAGVRMNRVTMDSGIVSAAIPPMNPMMQMMSMYANMLAAAFNASDRAHTHDNLDVVFKVGRTLGGNRSVYAEVARKTRAPSYQEAYLWLPLQSTGGLADGRSYIGNSALDSEVSREVNIGMNWRTERAWLGPQVFFKDVDGYIQGVPSTNAVANMVAMMMTGFPALEFANTDAEIYGLDLAWGRYLTEALTLHGVFTYVRGKRTDVADNLYRLAPMNARIDLSYEKSDWAADLEWAVYARQDRVSAYNAERETAGYGILNARVARSLASGFRLSASVENLFDKQYAAHLSGINRVAGVDVPLGERLYGMARTLRVGATFSW
jgi:iron complex outermembrane receptor protein